MSWRVLPASAVVALCCVMGACGQKEGKSAAPQAKTEAPPSKSFADAKANNSQAEREWSPRLETQTTRTRPERAPRGRRFAQEISMPHPLQTIPVSHMVTLPVIVRNTSQETWKAASNEETQPVNLSYHWLTGETQRKMRRLRKEIAGEASAPELRAAPTSWLSRRGQLVVMGGRRTVLPHDVQPGETVTLNAAIQAPDQPGDYTLRVTMVKESVAWFENRGAQPLDLPVKVTER